MGAERFDVIRKGTILQPTFSAAVDQAAYDFGHAGYTGSLAEKSDVELRSDKLFTREEAEQFAEKDLDDNDHDKWGPCWAVQLTEDGKTVSGFLFYGYASS